MDKLQIKLQIELLRLFQRSIQQWEKGEYAEMLDDDTRDTIIMHTLLDAVMNVYFDTSEENQCPECLIKALSDRLYRPSHKVATTKDGISIEEMDSQLDDVMRGVEEMIEEFKRLLDGDE